ncbi:MAG: hypothetical protein M3R63_22815 [Actinomycetota bacterium]|nr:hypothetical protein [Actinomycetota bacterium]
MLADVVQAGTKALGGARFSLVNVLPGTLFAVIVLAAIRAGAYGDREASLANVIPAASQRTAGGALVLVFGLFLLGVLLQPFQIALVQFLEGYWGHGRVGSAAGKLAVERHRRRYTTARAESDAEPSSPQETTFAQVAEFNRCQAAEARTKSRADALLKQLPIEPEHLMPTMLGNVLRNGEDYAGERYGLDALTVYPRMYPSLSKPISDAMSRQLDVIAVTAAMCVSSIAAALATAPVVRRLDPWSLIPLGALLLGVLAYRGALRAAGTHATLFATAFDLHRFDMLQALHYESPKTVDRELKLNRELTTFLQSRRPPHEELAEFGYEHPTVWSPPVQAQVPPQNGGAGGAPPAAQDAAPTEPVNADPAERTGSGPHDP